MKAVDHVLSVTEFAGGLLPIAESVTLDPFLNLKRETVYMKTIAVPSFRVWRSTDSVVLGRFLKPGEEVHLGRARTMNVPVLRRPSGGGAVFHDLGNVIYSIYIPPGHAPGVSIEESLRALSFPVTCMLDSLDVPWSWEPPNNVYVLGRKISGSAQARSGGHLLHHGTLLVSADLEKMDQLLKPGGRSRIAPVVNLSESVRGISAEDAAVMMSGVLGKQETMIPTSQARLLGKRYSVSV